MLTLKPLVFPSTLKTIGTAAFFTYDGRDQNDVGVDLEIPAGVTSIGNSAFHGYSGSAIIVHSNELLQTKSGWANSSANVIMP